ncbi:hypothetical protein ASG43_10285 [Aureimonas sp. Leaf454]|uniref:hypothetical protein n=1 Tax=Aureimonas sp. Leaf454 TaxID=1736381 RepID=UPI0007020C97|nr:hypothetical protein [Aureimonas sp. Leaf454]KQT47483.1 hypothetical protein ASG43_10285 [Aureimonas sp. Leaf454]
MPKKTFALLIAALAVCGFAAPAGTGQPSLIRHVHINGVSGPAYYSVVDGGYRPIRPVLAASASAEPMRVTTDIADATGTN